MDPGTGLTVLGAALGSKELVVKILGPTADYLGAGLKDWTERATMNVQRVFYQAAKKLGNTIETPGSVPPKVLKGVLEEAPFCDDELSAGYFGGVLASSRSEIGRDDRGAAHVALIGRLSAYQIRSHCFFYSIIRHLYGGSDQGSDQHEAIPFLLERRKLTTFVPEQAYFAAMEFDKAEDVNVILSHVMFGLAREALIENEFSVMGSKGDRYARPDDLRRPAEGGIVFIPSILGIELFFWALGRGDLKATDILNPTIDLTSDVNFTFTAGIRSVVYLRG